MTAVKPRQGETVIHESNEPQGSAEIAAPASAPKSRRATAAPERRAVPKKPATKVSDAKRTATKAKSVPAKKTSSRETKTEKVVALLRRSGGATAKELIKATAWQPHSVRGFLSGVIKKKLKLKLS
ncbi:MAG TPA: DUF3489 domain-containing protein, partial [Gemmataceae bacterium]